MSVKPKTPSERRRDSDARKKGEGLKRIGLWLTDAQVAHIEKIGQMFGLQSQAETISFCVQTAASSVGEGCAVDDSDSAEFAVAIADAAHAATIAIVASSIEHVARRSMARLWASGERMRVQEGERRAASFAEMDKPS